jgi:hypothetical protein
VVEEEVLKEMVDWWVERGLEVEEVPQKGC